MAFKPRKERRPPAEPTDQVLHDAAVNHLARYGATQAGVVRVLDRRIARWAQATGDTDGRATAAKAAARAAAIAAVALPTQGPVLAVIPEA